MQSAPRAACPGDGDSDSDNNNISHTCYACKATFRDHDALRNHKIQMRNEESFSERYVTHIYCHYCDQDFMTALAGQHHWEQFHAEKQDINCPGCDKHFVHFSAFVHHVEFHECPVISQENAAARCQKELDFARALERLDRMSRGVHRTKDFTLYLGGDRASSPTNHLPARPAITSGPSTFWPSDVQVPEDFEFPRLRTREHYHGNTNVPDLLTGDEYHPLQDKEGENPWAAAASLVPDAPAAQKHTPPEEMQLQLFNQENDEWQREENAMTRARGVVKAHPDDPSGHNFDPRRLFCPFTKAYKCPRCKKGKFKQWPALKQHMQSAAHAFTKTVACPCCKDSFKHLFSLAAHVESADKKCGLKHSDIFEIFLGQLTWNLIEVTGQHKNDGSTKFAISKKAELDYGVAQPAQPQLTFGHHQVHSSQSAVSRPQLTSSALSQLEKQPDQPLPRFKTPQQQREFQQQFPPLQPAKQPHQTLDSTQRLQAQAPAPPQMFQTHYQEQFPSLQKKPKPQPSQAKAELQAQSQPERFHGHYHRQQSQQDRGSQIWQRRWPQPQPQTRYQRQSQSQQQQPPQWEAHHEVQPSVQQQSRTQRLQAQQSPVRNLVSGLAESTLDQVPGFPSDKPGNEEEAWSNDSVGDGDGDGDAGW